jgi:hypothetical protein
MVYLVKIAGNPLCDDMNNNNIKTIKNQIHAIKYIKDDSKTIKD